MKWKKRSLVMLAFAFSLYLAIEPEVGAMHIMEGYLSPTYSIAWSVLALPFLILGYRSLKKTVAKDRSSLTLYAMAGAFVFVLSSLKIPSVTGSCSHMTGTGLGAILFGPLATSLLGVVVLLFQALLLAHGGLTTLGANTFSMAIAGPFFAYGLYRLGKNLKWNHHVTIFLAAFLGDFVTYLVTSLQLALAYPSQTGGVLGSAVKFLAVFAPTQLPLAIIEGILTLVIVIGLETYAIPELKGLQEARGGKA